MRRAERVTVQGPVKKQQPDGMSHGGAISQSPVNKPLRPLLSTPSPKDGTQLVTEWHLVRG